MEIVEMSNTFIHLIHNRAPCTFLGFFRITFPSFDEKRKGVNELDMHLQEIRKGELASLCEAATLLRAQATDIDEAIGETKEYLQKIQHLCVEVNKLFSL